MRNGRGGHPDQGRTEPQITMETRSSTPAGSLPTEGGSGGVQASLLSQTALPHRDPARYEIVGEHARGGIGRILKARDRDLDRVVAVKELLSSDVIAEARFKREIRLTARLEHPGIVPVHDAGHWISDGRSFYTMKLVAGASLKDVVAGLPELEPRLALTPHVLAVAEAVAYAHSRGVIHRDLKPSNVILGDYGETIVIDWGIAKEIGVDDDTGQADACAGDDAVGAVRADELTAVGTVVGTPVFMAPEQARGEPVDERADVYALGALAYFVLTGKAPYHGTGVAALRQVTAEPPVPLREREPRVPRDLAAIIEKAMAREPADRYQGAGELASDLRRYQAGRLVLAREYTWGERTVRWLRRHRIAATLTALFLALAAAGIVVAIRREQRLRHVAETERGRAEVQTRSLLEQQGRQELDAGRPHRAAVYLAEALRRDPGSRALRSLVSQALRPTEAHLRTLRGHERDVVCAAFSPDGARLVTGSTDTTVRIWNVAGGGEEQVLRGHERSLEDVAWSPDGALVASGDAGKVARVWRVGDGSLVQAFEGSVFRLAFSPDSAQLWTGGFDGSVRVRDIASGRELLAAKPYEDRVSVITFDPARGRAYTASWDGRFTVWDLASLAPLRTLDDQHAPIRFARLSGDGRHLLTGDEDGAIHVRDADTLGVQHSLRLTSAQHATDGWFGPGDQTIVTVSADGAARVWHATSGKVLMTIDAVPHGKLFDGALSADGTTLATASLRTVELWQLDTRGDARIFPGGAHVEAAFHPGALSADGRRLFVPRLLRDGPASIEVWDPTTGAKVGGWAEPGKPYSLAASRDGTRVVVGDLDGVTARLRDGTTGALVATLAGHAKMVYNVALSADDREIATASYDRTVRLWSAADGTPLEPVITVAARATAVAFDPGGTRLAVAIEDGTVTIFERATGAALRSFTAHPTWIQDVEWSPDGKRLVTAGRQDHTIKIWDLDGAGAAAPIVLSGHADNSARASFSPDGTVIASASVDDTARLWDARTGELLRTIPGPSQTAAFSPDGATLYTTGHRDYAVAWSLATEPRTPDELATAVAAASPWRLIDGRLVLPEN